MTRMSVAAVMSILILRGSEVVHRYSESSKYSFMNHGPPVAAFSARRRVMAHLTEVKIDAHVGGSCHELRDFARQ